MKIKVVYFAYLKDVNGTNWEEVVCEQMNSLKSIGLYNIIEDVSLVVVCDDKQLKRLKQHIWAKWKKVKIYARTNVNQYEYPGLKAVWEIAQKEDDSIILYFHTKGISNSSKKRGGSSIRRIMFDTTIRNYDLYLEEFKKNKDLDLGMVFPSEYGFSWYNFFWAKSSYVKNHLPEPKYTSHRYYWERWIGSEYSSKKDIKTFSPFLGYKKTGNKAQFANLRNKVWKMHSK